MKIGVVIVTRNRADCLKTALKKYDEQTKLPEYIVVVNNCSTDGGATERVLAEWEEEKRDYKKIVVTSTENSGGSGGFWLAEKTALEYDADWIWHADDDAYPDIRALEMIEEAYNNEHGNVAAYSASIRDVENPDVDISCWKILYKGPFFVKWISPKVSGDYFDVDKFMYLGCVVNKQVLMCAGLTNKAFFIHEDDIEHSMRVRKKGRIVAVKSALLYHPAWKDSIDPQSINWKYYYKVRNKIISIGDNYGEKYRQSEVVKAWIKLIIHILQRYPKSVIEMEKAAIRDGRKNILGKCESYKPE